MVMKSGEEGLKKLGTGGQDFIIDRMRTGIAADPTAQSLAQAQHAEEADGHGEAREEHGTARGGEGARERLRAPADLQLAAPQLDVAVERSVPEDDEPRHVT